MFVKFSFLLAAAALLQMAPTVNASWYRSGKVSGAVEQKVRNIGPERASDSDSNRTSITLRDDIFQDFLESHEDVFLLMYAPWCVWCQRLRPTWEGFAEEVKKREMPVQVASLDCMAEANACRRLKVMAFPTMRWFHKQEMVPPDFKSNRTVDELMIFAKARLGVLHDEGRGVYRDEEREHDEHDHEDQNEETEDKEWSDDEEQDQESDEDDDTWGLAVHRHAPVPLPAKRFNQMEAKCRAVGLSYGPINLYQRVSSEGGDEFLEYSERKIKVAPACSSASSNTRGKYSSYIRPCEFEFHVVPETAPGNAFELSTACSNDNAYNIKKQGGKEKKEATIVDYVRGWPDECVGDYTRCYAVSNDKEAAIFMPHFCRNNWDIPEVVTHVSVNCKEDKVAAIQKKQSSTGNPGEALYTKQLNQQAQHHREKVMLVLLVISVAGCCCWTFSCFVYKLVIVPYLKAMKKSKSDPDLQSLVAAAALEEKEKAVAGDSLT